MPIDACIQAAQRQNSPRRRKNAKKDGKNSGVGNFFFASSFAPSRLRGAFGFGQSGNLI